MRWAMVVLAALVLAVGLSAPGPAAAGSSKASARCGAWADELMAVEASPDWTDWAEGSFSDLRAIQPRVGFVKYGLHLRGCNADLTISSERCMRVAFDLASDGLRGVRLIEATRARDCAPEVTTGRWWEAHP